MNKTLEQTVKKILNTGASGDLDASGCADYNPELVEKVVKLISKERLAVLDYVIKELVIIRNTELVEKPMEKNRAAFNVNVLINALAKLKEA